MSLESQVDDIQTKLDAISERFKVHEQSARNLIDTDRESILSCLQSGIHSVQTVFESLEDDQNTGMNSEDQLLTPMNYISIETPKIPGAFVTELESLDAGLAVVVPLKERCALISTCFTELAKLADKQLDDAMEIQLAAMDVEAELDRLKIELDQTTENAQSEVSATHKSLETKRLEHDSAQSQLATIEADLRVVENKASENKTQRKVAKFVSIPSSLHLSQAKPMELTTHRSNLALWQ